MGKSMRKWWYGMDLVPLPIQRHFVFKEAMHGKLSISLRRWGILVRSRNWNGAIPIPQVYLNLGSALCRLDPSLSFSLQRRRRLLLHFSAIAPAAGRRARRARPALSVPSAWSSFLERKGTTDRPATAVPLGEISNLYSAHQSDSSCWQRHQRKKPRFREDDTTDRQTDRQTLTD